MKKYRVLLLLFFCSATSHASDECVSELSSSSNYGDLNKIFACFNGKIKALEVKLGKLEAEKASNEEAPETNQTPPKQTTIKPKPVAQTVEKNGFTFNLSQCARKGKRNIACEISIISSKDSVLTMYVDGHSAISIASSGIQYAAASASLGASGQKSGYVSYRMVYDLPLKSVINFSSIPSDEEGFALFEINTHQTGVVQFRDVRFTDQE